MGIEEDDDVGKEVLVGGESTVSTAIVISSANAGGIQKCDFVITVFGWFTKNFSSATSDGLSYPNTLLISQFMVIFFLMFF